MSLARCVLAMTPAVEGALVPAIRISPGLAKSATNFRTESRSASDMRLYSPEDPQGTQPDTSAARSMVRCFSKAAKSIFPSASKGVTRAGITPESFSMGSILCAGCEQSCRHSVDLNLAFSGSGVNVQNNLCRHDWTFALAC